jgi:glutamate-1-semialdehyde 2,1-aminomutase
MNINKSIDLFARAGNKIPGGVNSPVRAFKSVGGTPIFMRSAKGAWMTDADGNQYIDLINSWGPMILGHAHPDVVQAVAETIQHSFSFGAPTGREVEMADTIIQMVPSVEMVRMVNSGTEATMSAIRVARGFTGRDKIIKFEGCYHGHGDSFLIAAGSGAMTFGIPDSKGVTQGVAQDTLTAPYNDLEAVEVLFNNNPDAIAALILEPVVGNMGLVNPDPGFLQGIRALCDQHGTVLIFDEVMTGFRLAAGGAQAKLGVIPDISTFGKIIGGGLPVGAYGGKKSIMEQVAPVGPVYQAGTLSGNPVAMAAGLATLAILNRDTDLYTRLDKKTEKIHVGLEEIFHRKGMPVCINRNGSMFTVFFAEGPVRNLADAKRADTKLFSTFFHGMLDRGVYPAPSQFEAMFISDAIGEAEIGHILNAAEETLKNI